MGSLRVKLDGLNQVDLGDYSHICGIEDRRILQRFVLAFRYLKQNETEIFT
jgi:hypothetical protein